MTKENTRQQCQSHTGVSRKGRNAEQNMWNRGDTKYRRREAFSVYKGNNITYQLFKRSSSCLQFHLTCVLSPSSIRQCFRIPRPGQGWVSRGSQSATCSKRLSKCTQMAVSYVLTFSWRCLWGQNRIPGPVHQVDRHLTVILGEWIEPWFHTSQGEAFEA